MHNHKYAIKPICRLSRILSREINSPYYGKECFFMEKEKWIKLGMSVLGLALTIGASLVNGKVSDSKMEETIREEVKKQLSDQ